MAADHGSKIDISAGLDSRIMCSFASFSGAQHAYNVNYSSNIASQEVKIARLIADGENRHLQVIP